MENLESLWDQASPEKQGDLTSLWNSVAPKQNLSDKGLAETYSDWLAQGAKGALAGSANIGNTLINASTFIPRKLAAAVGNKEAEEYNKAREESLKSWIKENKGSIPFAAGEIAAELAGTGGVGKVLSGAAKLANLDRLSKALETGGFAPLPEGSAISNALTRLAAGAGVGAASSGMVNPEDTGAGAVLGAGAVGAGVPLIKGAALGAGKLYDLVSGRLPQVAAGQLGRDVAGKEVDQIIAANAAAPSDITSSQAAIGVPRFEWQNLGERARQGDPTLYGLKADAQEAARLKALDNVTPNLDAAVARRTAVTAPIYNDAMNSTAKVNTNSVVKTIDKFIDDNPKLSSITTPLNTIRDSLLDSTGQGLDTNVKSLSSLSQDIKGMIEARNPDGTPQFDVKALTTIKDKLDSQIGAAEPKYALAREKFKQMSEAVNQSQLLSAMRDTLVNNRGGERVGPFLNAMGTGEASLFRRADQSPRFGSLDEVLSPAQKQVKDNIVSQLQRDAEVTRRSRESSQKVSELINGDTIQARLPSLIDRWFAAANKGIDIAEAHINRKTMQALSAGMQSGKSANEMLNTLPTSEKNKVLRALINMPQGQIIPAAVGVFGTNE